MYRPTHDWILVERTTGRRTDGGIVLPDTAGEAHARVVAAGPGAYSSGGELIPMSVAVGDLVIIPAGAPAVEVPYKGQTLMAVRDRDVLAVIPPEDAAPQMVTLGDAIPPTERPS